jgi:hypothetical protein
MPPCYDLHGGDRAHNSGCRLVNALFIFFRIHIVVCALYCRGVKCGGRGVAVASKVASEK